MENFSFQPAVDKPSKKDVLPIQKFRTEERPAKDKMDNEERKAKVDDLIDLYFADRGGMDGDPGGSEFQNRMTNFLIQEDINADPSSSFMTTLTRKISADVRNESNEDVPKTLRGVASVASFLLDTAKEPTVPGQERVLGFNKSLDDQYAIDVIDSSYEVVEGQMVIHKLQLIQVKSYENIAREEASGIYRDHSEFVNNFEMMAKWQSAQRLNFEAEESLSIAEFESIATDEVLTVMIAHSDGVGKGNFDINTLREDLRNSLGTEEVSIEEINFLGKVIENKKNTESLDDDELRAVEDIVGIIKEAVAEHQSEKVVYKAPVVFAEDAEIKSVIVAHILANGKRGGVLEDLTRDIAPPVKH